MFKTLYDNKTKAEKNSSVENSKINFELIGSSLKLLKRKSVSTHSRKGNPRNKVSFKQSNSQYVYNYFGEEKQAKTKSRQKKKLNKTGGYIREAILKKKELIEEVDSAETTVIAKVEINSGLRDLVSTQESIEKQDIVKKTCPSFVKRFHKMERTEGKCCSGGGGSSLEGGGDNIEKLYSDILLDKDISCSSSECNTFIGQAIINRNFPQDYKRSNASPSHVQPSDAYLEDTYNFLFQRHVDNLNNLITQHNQEGGEKTKTEVHIHPTVNCYQHELVGKKNQKKKLSNLEDVTKKRMNKITEQFNEFNFEELNNNLKPVIVFNHVSTVTEHKTDFETICREEKGSRSPSPLLEVPSLVEVDKKSTRPPF